MTSTTNGFHNPHHHHHHHHQQQQHYHHNQINGQETSINHQEQNSNTKMDSEPGLCLFEIFFIILFLSSLQI